MSTIEVDQKRGAMTLWILIAGFCFCFMFFSMRACEERRYEAWEKVGTAPTHPAGLADGLPDRCRIVDCEVVIGGEGLDP